MAFAPPNARKVQFKRNQELREMRTLRAAAIAAEEARRKKKQEIRSCYHEHSPAQLAHAGEMIRCDKAWIVPEKPVEWEVIGRSNGGKTRGVLRVCRAVSV